MPAKQQLPPKDLYYIAPSDNIFLEVKNKAIDIWRTYDDTYWYATSKIDRIKDIRNIRDNMMYIVAMFDPVNTSKLLNSLSDEAKTAIAGRVSPLQLYFMLNS